MKVFVETKKNGTLITHLPLIFMKGWCRVSITYGIDGPLEIPDIQDVPVDEITTIYMMQVN